MTAALLEVRGVTKKFGGLTANDDVSFTVAEGEFVSIIGQGRWAGGSVSRGQGNLSGKGRRTSNRPSFTVASRVSRAKRLARSWLAVMTFDRSAA